MMKKTATALALLAMTVMANAQNTYTREQVLAMTTEQLTELSFEDLMAAIDAVGVSTPDELFALIMNKNVSSASKKDEDTFRSPLSTSVITKDEMKRYGVTSLEEAFRLVPGVIVREKVNGMYDVHLRGLGNMPDHNLPLYTENVNTLVMLDGRPIFNYAQGSAMWETFPVGIEDIDRIEVVRGACSALYGSNAVTGVINIITEKPAATSKLVEATVNAGSKHTMVGSVALRKSLSSKVAVGLSANVNRRERGTDKEFLMPSQTQLVSIAAGEDQPVELPKSGGWYTAEELDNIRKADTDANGIHYRLFKPEATAMALYGKEPERARRNWSANGYIHVMPNADVDINVTGGYQNSFAYSTAFGDEWCTLMGRDSETGYVNATAGLYGASLQVNYLFGNQDFYKGTPGYKARAQQLNVVGAYDWRLGQNFSLRPEFTYQWYAFDDSKYPFYFDYGSYYGGEPNMQAFSGIINGYLDVRTYAGSLRADYHVGQKLRVIAALRAEKLEMPDKLMPSWQFAATYSPTDNQLIRLTAGRANRSSIVANTSVNYRSRRTGMSLPNYNSFLGNKNADVMYADNYEVGYRIRPTQRISIDAEAFYNISQDYGMLMADHSELNIAESDLPQILATGSPIYSAECFIKYRNQPIKVHQKGISVNMDWIASDKLILKFAANVQQTKIDNYTIYYQSLAFGNQLTACAGQLTQTATALLNDYMTAAYMGQTDAFLASKARPTADGTGYYLDFSEYGLPYDGAKKQYTISNSEVSGAFSAPRNGYKHKYDPAFYGTVGAICKPMSKLNVSAFAYFYGKQEVASQLASFIDGGGEITSKPVTVSGKCVVDMKIGYEVVKGIEVSANAHNLLNDKSREFEFCDNIGGVYTVGLNIEF